MAKNDLYYGKKREDASIQELSHTNVLRSYPTPHKKVQILETRSLVSPYLLPSGQQDGGGGGRGSFVCGRYNSRFTTRQTRSLTTGHKKNEEGEEGGRQQQMPKSDFPSYFFSPPLLHNPDRASLPGGRVRGGTGVNHRRKEYKNTKRKIVK